MPLESRRIAAFLLGRPDDKAWRKALVDDNLLQKKAPATALRQAGLIRKRLKTLDDTGLDMIAHREKEVSIQLLLAAAAKHSALLAHYIRDVYISHQRRLDLALSPPDWHGFLNECQHRDATVARWSSTTQAKLFQVIRRILVEANYLDNASNMKLTPQSLHPDVRHYLSVHGNTALIELLERA